ncbi:MAG: ABC transporter substrate-binding protein [Bacillota bacterium]|nr:ABC transporter substrate-binding protein [Bacillota bacterium]
MKKILSMGLALMLTASLAGCGTSSGSKSAQGDGNGKVTIIATNGKGEIASQFTQAAKDFMAANPDITVETYSTAVGDTLNVFDKLTASGKVVTLAMVEPNTIVDKYKGVGIDLSGEKWNSDTSYAIKDSDGKITGFPFAVEGFGLVYNQKVLDKAVGGTFNPFTINTRDKLKALLDKIKASGIKYPVAYQTEAWSVANHYSSQWLNQSDDPAKLAEQAKNGEFDFANNAVWNGYYDTMDLLASKDYNKYGDRPLGKYYDDAHLAVGKGESALLFNGNWAYDSLKAVAGDKFGFIPVPVDNDENNPLNNKLVVGATQAFIINKSATKAQQDAAKKFLNWLVYDKAGQDFVVNKSQVISGFKNNPNKVTNPLGAAIADAIAQNKTMSFTTNYVNASDYMSILGPDVQKYIDKKETRKDLAKAFTEYYKSKKN